MRQLIIFSLIVLFVGCIGHKNERIELITGIRSCLTSEEIRKFTNLKNYNWITIENEKLKQGDPRPDFEILKIKIQDYNDLGIDGDLVLEFFNNKLMSTCFYPADVNEYLINLEYVRGIIITKEGQKIYLQKCQIYYGKDFNNLIYIEWADKRLLKEYNNWLSTYS